MTCEPEVLYMQGNLPANCTPPPTSLAGMAIKVFLLMVRLLPLAVLSKSMVSGAGGYPRE